MTRSELSFFFTYKYCNIQTEKDIAIRQRVEDHLIEVINDKIVDPHQIVFIALEGSQNYGLDTVDSDVDTKLIITPTLEDVIYGRRLESTTHVRANNEHTGIYDIRRFLPVLKNQNINFLEVLFSSWIIINREYEDVIAPLFENRELITRYNEVKAVKTIAGIATDRYKAIYNKNSLRADIIEKYGYDGKAISHLLRLEQFFYMYCENSSVSFMKCIKPVYTGLIIKLKENKIDVNWAKNLAETTYETINTMVDSFIASHEETVRLDADLILNEVQVAVMKRSLKIK